MKTYPPAQAFAGPQADTVPQLIAATAHTLPEEVNALARARAFAEPLMAGETLDFATVTASTVYDGSGVLVKANVDPADATNKNVKWYIDNKDQFELKDEDKTAGTVKVVAKASCTSASSVATAKAAGSRPPGTCSRRACAMPASMGWATCQSLTCW